MRVVCVLTGDKYSDKDVYQLQKQIEQHTTVPYQFVCFSDRQLDCETVLIEDDDDYGVWNKLRIFQFKEQTLYFDLDVRLQHNIDHLFRERLTVVECFWKPKWEDDTPYGKHNTKFNTSIMSWKGDYSYLWDEFSKEIDYNMVTYSGMDRWLNQQVQLIGYERGCAFSRAYGIDENSLPNDDNFFIDDTATVCLYNGPGKVKMEEDFDRLN